VPNYCDNCTHSGSEHHMSIGKCGGEVTDLYGTWQCLCVRFERDPDE